MHNASFHRKILLLLLVAVLAAPWASAADSAAPAQARELFRLDFLGHLWTVLHSVWSQEGCRIDPNGSCLPSAAQPPPPPVHPKTGCRIDPNGLCLPGVTQPTPPANQADTGCRIDPDGLCRS